jgi:hypothetical protein
MDPGDAPAPARTSARVSVRRVAGAYAARLVDLMAGVLRADPAIGAVVLECASTRLPARPE